jgi:hypothetical protein
MGVFTRRTVGMLAVIMLLALTISASAKPIHSSFTLPASAKLSGAELKAGDYNVNADDTKVTLLFKGKVVAEAKVEWKDGTSKASQTSVLIAGDEIKEIRFEGKTKYAVIMP